MPAAGRPYGLRNQSKIKSGLKVSVEGGRAILLDTAAAKKTARQRMTRALRSGQFKGMPDYAGGQSLHDGLVAMADRSGLSDSEMFARIDAMDPQVLAEMYSQDKLVFEVVYNYEGIRKNADGEYEVIDAERKQNDFEFFLGEYNRYAAATGRRTV